MVESAVGNTFLTSHISPVVIVALSCLKILDTVLEVKWCCVHQNNHSSWCGRKATVDDIFDSVNCKRITAEKKPILSFIINIVFLNNYFLCIFCNLFLWRFQLPDKTFRRVTIKNTLKYLARWNMAIRVGYRIATLPVIPVK